MSICHKAYLRKAYRLPTEKTKKKFTNIIVYCILGKFDEGIVRQFTLLEHLVNKSLVN